MSKFHLPQRFFKGKELIDMLSYGSRTPEILSKRQKVNRLYMASIRAAYNQYMLDSHHNSLKFHETLLDIKSEFRYIKTLNESDFDFDRITSKWRTFVADLFDVYGVVTDNRPYSLNSSKYYIYSDELLMSDPYGYYTQERVVFGHDKPENSVYASDFPLGDEAWKISDLTVGGSIMESLIQRKDV